ncbi:MAG: SpoIIE family protein phosphatase [Salinivirgaceae bacterium]|nr:SpoIIE family protein phosphatase [Salinivirgaceae bacterium]MDY0279583.1 SpoIIE family protein phosphatase [Salinivirgaceae bacterium]
MAKSIEEFLQQTKTFFDKTERRGIIKGCRMGGNDNLFVYRLYKERYESVIRLFADYAFLCTANGKIKELHFAQDFKSKASEILVEDVLNETLHKDQEFLKEARDTIRSKIRTTFPITILIQGERRLYEFVIDYFDDETALIFGKNISEPLLTENSSESYMTELINSRFAQTIHEKHSLAKENVKLSSINRDLLDSITYARKIQRAIFPDIQDFKQVFHDSFILFQPRDLVSGDLYWFDNYEDTKVIAVVDCTGHGVPGAFIAVLSYSLLNKILSENNVMFKQPSELLSELHFELTRVLNHDKELSEISDGMDIGLCLINNNHNILYFSGAFHNLYHVSQGVLQIYKGDKLSVGGNNYGKKELFRFTTTMIEYNNDDVFYLTTDGYLDQFGGDRDKRFLNRRFRSMIEQNFARPMVEQKELFLSQYEEWRGENDQIDDVLIVGFRCRF